MTFLQIFVLAVVQGVTEFLPISSSAHLILVPQLTGWPDQGLGFDVAVHVGTLIAVVTYFWGDLVGMLRDWLRSLLGGEQTPGSRLAWQVLVATIPVGLAGVLLKDQVEGALRTPLVIAAATVGFGLLLWWADARARDERDEYHLSWHDVLIIGFAQALALIPGTSRSGITITAGLARGVSRTGAARFSFLLSIPVILSAGLFNVVDLVQDGTAAVDWRPLLWGTLLSGATAYLCIHYFLKLVERIGMLPFVIYRFVLGLVLVGIFL